MSSLSEDCRYGHYLHALEYVQQMDEAVHATLVARHLDDYLQRGWLRVAGYHDGETVEDGFGCIAEVDFTIDLDAGIYHYPSPFWAGATIVKPIKDITYYAFCIDRFLDDLATLVGVEHRAKKTEVIPAYLWELGQLRVATVDRWVRIFVARHEHDLPHPQIRAWLDDEVCPGQGILLVNNLTSASALGEHVQLCLGDLVDEQDASSQFRMDKLQRILMRYAQPAQPQPEFLDGQQLKLPHFSEVMTLSPALANIVRLAWGTQGRRAPVVSWVEINKNARNGYVSFDDAFGSKEAREQVFALVSRGKYRLRRSDSAKP